MTNLILLVKAYNSRQLSEIDNLLQNQFEDLDVKLKLDVTVNKWVIVWVSGEDENVVINYMRKEIGTCPVKFDVINEGEVFRGYVSKIEEKGLKVDIGVFEPEVKHVILPLTVLEAQLTIPSGEPSKKIFENYGIAEGLPIIVRITSKDSDLFKCELAPVQIDKFRVWQQSLLDRLIILRTSKEHVTSVLERTHLNRDVIDVEELGMFEYALTCKLGTDARGLIPKVGRYMRNTLFVVFNAKKSLCLLNK